MAHIPLLDLVIYLECVAFYIVFYGHRGFNTKWQSDLSTWEHYAALYMPKVALIPGKWH